MQTISVESVGCTVRCAIHYVFYKVKLCQKQDWVPL
jgi:uncharacterized Fe-S cluster-containing radical SAM superfamily protein